MSCFVISGSLMLLTVISSVSGQTLWTEENCGLSLTYPTGESDYFGVNNMVPPNCRWRISLPERFDAILIGVALTDFSCGDGYLGFADQSGTVCGVCDSLDVDFRQIYVRTDRCTVQEIWDALENADFFGTKGVIHRGLKDAIIQIDSLKNVSIFAQFDIDYKLYKCSGTKRARFNPNIGSGLPITRNSRQEDCSSFSNNTSPRMGKSFQISNSMLHENENSTMSPEMLNPTSQTLDTTTAKFKPPEPSTTHKSVSAKPASAKLTTTKNYPTSTLIPTEEELTTTDPITKAKSTKYPATTQSSKIESYLEELTTIEPITEEKTRDNTAVGLIFTTTQSTKKKSFSEVSTTIEPIKGVTRHDTVITPNFTKYTTTQSTETKPYLEISTTIEPITKGVAEPNSVITPNFTKYTTTQSTETKPYLEISTTIEPITKGVAEPNSVITLNFTKYTTMQSTKTKPYLEISTTIEPITKGIAEPNSVITPNFTKYTTMQSTETKPYLEILTTIEPITKGVAEPDSVITPNFTKYTTTQSTKTESYSDELTTAKGVGPPARHEPFQTAVIIGATVAGLVLITLIILLIRRKQRKAKRVKKKMKVNDGKGNLETLL